HNYSSNWRNTNVTDTQANTAVQKFATLYSQLKSELGSEENRFFVHIDKMKQWKDDPRLKDYKRDMEDWIDSYEHKLSDDVEN
ncbi:oligoendopeptidase F, partial [Mycoplasmopsis pullorum]